MDLSWKRHCVKDIYESYRDVFGVRDTYRDYHLPRLSQLIHAWQDLDFVNPGLITEEMISYAGRSDSNVARSLVKTEDMTEKLYIYSHITKLNLKMKLLKTIKYTRMMENLVELDLSLNQLIVLENLDSLVKLEILDLGYNKIEKIQGLNALINLKNLNMKMNQIQTIEGLDSSTKLEIFNIASNRIHSYDSITYLRKFEHLTRLNIENNPVCVNQDGDSFVKAMVPQIQCYNYQLVSDNQRRAALKIYENDVLTERLNNLLLEREKKKSLKVLDEMKERSELFVEKLEGDYLFLSLFENDTDGQEMLKLCKIPTKLGTSVNQIYSDFKRDFMEVASKLYEYGKGQYINRKKEIREFESVYKRQKLKVHQEFKLILDTCRKNKIEFTKKIMNIAHKIEIIKEHEKLIEDKENASSFSSTIINSENNFKFVDDKLEEIIYTLREFRIKNSSVSSHQTFNEDENEADNIAASTTRGTIGNNYRIGYLKPSNDDIDKILQVLSSIRYNRTDLECIDSNYLYKELKYKLETLDTVNSIQSNETSSISDEKFSGTPSQGDQTIFENEMKEFGDEKRKFIRNPSFYSQMNELDEQMFEDEMSDVSRDVVMFEDKKDPKVIIECMIHRINQEAEQVFLQFDEAIEEILFEEYRLHANLRWFYKHFNFTMEMLNFDFRVEIAINFDLLRKQATEFNEELGKLLGNFYKNVKNKKAYRKYPVLYRILSEEEAMADALMNSFGEVMDVLWGQEDELTEKLAKYLEDMVMKIEEEEVDRHTKTCRQVDDYLKSCREDVKCALQKINNFIE